MLNAKQAAFVREYLVDLNATQAAIRAGYSKKTANEQGARLLAKVSVREAVDAGMSKRAEKLELTAERVLGDIDRLARVAESEGQLGVAMKGQELLGKHLKLFTEKVEHTFDGLSDEQLEARFRALVADAAPVPKEPEGGAE